ncbi:hypothetical protein [Peijinzhouia sedimentorum]
MALEKRNIHSPQCQPWDNEIAQINLQTVDEPVTYGIQTRTAI